MNTFLLVAALPRHIDKEKPISSFAFFGCNRVDKEDWNKDQNPSSANLHQLEQTFVDLARQNKPPRFVFGGGDLVLGYGDDKGEKTYSQLTAWRRQFFSSPLAGKTTMIPFPGNHELNKKTSEGKLPNPPTVAMWNRWYQESGFHQMATNGPKEKGKNPDHLIGDQSRLSYSFDDHGVHYVILNTDTLTSVKDAKTGQGKVGMIPAHWAKQDIEMAQKSKSVKAIFVMGHRNLVDPKDCTGDSPIEKGCGEILLKAIKDNSKVKAYVCAHVHAWGLQNLGGKSHAWQLIAGNAGSSLEKDWKPVGGTFFGFARIDVYRNGRVVLEDFRRPTPTEPQKYSDSSPVHPAPAQPKEFILFAGRG